MRWGSSLEYTAEAGPGDFIFVPPFVPHQEINALDDVVLRCVIVRSQPAAPGGPVIFNLPDLVAVESSLTQWVDNVHPAGHAYAENTSRSGHSDSSESHTTHKHDH